MPFPVYLLTKHRAHICDSMPEYETLAFFCSSMYLQTIDDPLREWVASPKGNEFFRQTIQGFQKQETTEQICLRVFALLGFEKILSSQSDILSDPVRDCYLEDFGWLLDGEEPDNRHALLLRMTFSLRRVVGGLCDEKISGYFKLVQTEPPFHSSDKLSDKYWQLRALQHYDHSTAWKFIWKQGKEDITRC